MGLLGLLSWFRHLPPARGKGYLDTDLDEGRELSHGVEIPFLILSGVE